MPAESVQRFEALAAQAAQIMDLFTAAEFEHVAPAVIQPANVFLDAIGESVRGRTYVFTDPDGDELCLRPDLTVPTARLYLERFPNAEHKARYCYNGPAFRFQPVGADTQHPREFRQAGVESFGDPDREKAEAEVTALAIDAVRRSGLNDFVLRIGDLGLYKSLLGAIDMPARWRAKLIHDFWRPDAFAEQLKQLCAGLPKGQTGISEALLSKLEPEDPERAMEVVAAYMETHSIQYVGARRLSEITEQLLNLAADRRAEPLSEDAAELIQAYLAIKAPPRAAGARITDLIGERGMDLEPALEIFRRRNELLGQAGVDLAQAEFSAEFGRDLEYYSGYVFQIEVPAFGQSGHIAGGGRYDGLLRAVGAPHDVPGVGLAVHTERLLTAVRGEIE